MEQEIIAARQAAERAQKANTAFLAAASHDLRQPVQALSLLNGALRRTVDNPLAKEMIESQQHSLDAMTNLLNSLLDISRLDAGAVTPEFEEFPMQRLIDRLSPEFARQARRNAVRAMIDALAARGEFFTSYTPYQPEVSQGTLQVIAADVVEIHRGPFQRRRENLEESLRRGGPQQTIQTLLLLLRNPLCGGSRSLGPLQWSLGEQCTRSTAKHAIPN